MEAFPWGIVIVGGPLLLGLALLWAMLRSRKAADRADPNPPRTIRRRGCRGGRRAKWAQVLPVTWPPERPGPRGR